MAKIVCRENELVKFLLMGVCLLNLIVMMAGSVWVLRSTFFFFFLGLKYRFSLANLRFIQS